MISNDLKQSPIREFSWRE